MTLDYPGIDTVYLPSFGNDPGVSDHASGRVSARPGFRAHEVGSYGRRPSSACVALRAAARRPLATAREAQRSQHSTSWVSWVSWVPMDASTQSGGGAGQVLLRLRGSLAVTQTSCGSLPQRERVACLAGAALQSALGSRR